MTPAIVLLTLCCVFTASGNPPTESAGQRRNLGRGSPPNDPLECGCDEYAPRQELYGKCMICFKQFSEDGSKFAGCLRDNNVMLDERARNYVTECECNDYKPQLHQQCLDCRNQYVTDRSGFGGCMRHNLYLSGSSQLAPPTGFNILFALTLVIRFLLPLISSIKNSASKADPHRGGMVKPFSFNGQELQRLYMEMLVDNEQSIPPNRITAVLQNLGMGIEGIEAITPDNGGNIDFPGFRMIMSKVISDRGVFKTLSKVAPMDRKGRKVLVEKLITLFSQATQSQKEQHIEELVNNEDHDGDGKLGEDELENLTEVLKHQ